jgi:hypothetical protein
MTPSGPAPAGTPQVKALNCPNCGAALTIRSFAHAINIVCPGCHSILDAQDPLHKVLQQFKAATDEDAPLIPLGTRGKIRGQDYAVIGFQRRSIEVDGIPYSWHEYLLFNPYRGFRYLTEYDGHWNDTSSLRALPAVHRETDPVTVTYLGETFQHFQTAKASTRFVLGEFPWQVRVSETVSVSDYISPPRVLSSEATNQEVTWSMGEYMTGADVWKAFRLQGDPPPAVGVYENQPSPLSQAARNIWWSFGFLAIVLFVLMLGFSAFDRNETVLHGDYVFHPGQPGEASFVTDVFDLKGRTSNVEIATQTNVSNNWIYLSFALINQDTGRAFDLGKEVSYYSGADEDGVWTEGSSHGTVTVPSVPPGQYYLRIEPEGQPGSYPITYSITVKRDVPKFSWFFLAFLALLLPAVVLSWRSLNFEHRRWAESDHTSSYSSSSGDDD